jgi:hypothetical protein
MDAFDLPPDSDSEEQVPFEVVARMTFHAKRRNSAARGKKAKITTAKDIRSKDFQYLFAPTKDNYLAFLQIILEKHHLLQYSVSDQSVFPCKVQVPPSKYVTVIFLPRVVLILCRSSKTDASYMINLEEYTALANKILKKRPSKPITVFIDLLDVEKALSKVSMAKLRSMWSYPLLYRRKLVFL